ncbi:MAG: ABC transporter ATP-binding protein [Acidobacteria bacterium]|nr:ABC transporter ATP-binding protein [Acidobacteriota bacterium]
MSFEVHLDKIDKVYGETWALKGVSATIQTGDRITIVGHNGAGKSTLLGLTATLTNPTRGTICYEIDGTVAKDRGQIRRHMSMLSHSPMLYADLTARENLKFFAGLYGVSTDHHGIDSRLEKVGMKAAGDTLFRACSRGMQQRISFARAMLGDPDLLLLDEPFSGLDKKGTERLKNILMTEYRHGWLLVTHDLGQGYEMANRLWIFKHGRLAHNLKKSELDFKEYVSLCEANLPEEVLR